MIIWPLMRVLFVLLLLAIILGYAFYRTFQKSEDPQRLIVKWAGTVVLIGAGAFIVRGSGPFMPLFVLPFAIIIGLIWAPSWGAVLASPLTSLFDGGGIEVEPTPVYSMAERQRHRGDHAAAAAEVQKQLDRFPNDYVGQMLLASIYAENLNDISRAQLIVDRMLNQTGHTPPNISDALLRMAEWHLKMRQDVEAARQCLERIPALLPDTQFAHNAEHRLHQFGGTAEMLISHERRIITMVDSGRAPPSLKDGDPATLARECIDRLEKFPLDTAVREQLALIYAEHYGRLDMGIAELEQLLALPDQTTKNVVRWLNLLADLHVKFRGDLASATAALQRIAALFPETAWAENARTRLAYLPLETKSQQVTQVVKMQSYQSDLGLRPSAVERDAENASKPFKRLMRE